MSIGTRIINDPEFPENVLKNIANARLRRIKINPPIISFFHAMTKATIRTKAGMLCTRKPISFLPMESSPPKTSRENIIMKSIARIPRILGNQNRILSIVAG